VLRLLNLWILGIDILWRTMAKRLRLLLLLVNGFIC
jgi:hypothetical protein